MSKSKQYNEKVHKTLLQNRALRDAVGECVLDYIGHYQSGRMSADLETKFVDIIDGVALRSIPHIVLATMLLNFTVEYNVYRHGEGRVSLDNLLVKLPGQPSNKTVRRRV